MAVLGDVGRPLCASVSSPHLLQRGMHPQVAVRLEEGMNMVQMLRKSDEMTQPASRAHNICPWDSWSEVPVQWFPFVHDSSGSPWILGVVVKRAVRPSSPALSEAAEAHRGNAMGTRSHSLPWNDCRAEYLPLALRGESSLLGSELWKDPCLPCTHPLSLPPDSSVP